MKQPRIDFVGKSRIWAITSAVLIGLALLGVLVRDLNLSIEFEGGSSYSVEQITRDTDVDEVRSAVEAAGGDDVRVQFVTDPAGGEGVLVRMAQVEIGGPTSLAVRDALTEVTGSTLVQESFVGPTWGGEISRRAIEALIVFMIVVVAYISIRLEWKMAVAAIVALVHDLVLTMGVYIWVGFPVSPATVIALLTIIGYSLYDTVVVFDRIEENMTYLGEPGRRTFQQVVNTSQNEVLWRSINTTMTSLLPVGGLLFIGAGLLGASTLQDMALALFVGMGLGAYSSLFVAGPLLAWWRGKEPEMAALLARRSDPDEEVIAPTPEAATAARKPITTDYVRGQGKGKRRRGR
jgi:preprotein translocase subunit SecF